jgi:hypothetical protein
MSLVQENYIGSGICYLDGRDVGNVSKVNIAIELDEKAKPNHRGGGGNIASLSRISSVKLGLTFDSFVNKNLALALRGKVDVETSANIVDESVVAVGAGLAQTAKMIDVTQAVVVKDSGDLALTLDTDYQVTSAGILAIDGGAISDGDTIKITYDSIAGSALQAMVESGQEFKFVFDGINDHNGKRSVVTAYKFKPSPTSGLDLIGDDYGEFEIEGELLADTSIITTGKSQFFQRVAQS